MHARAQRWAWAAGIVLAGAAAYYPSLAGGWLWDDDQYVTQNPLLRSAAGLRRIWLEPAGVNYFPLTQTARWLQWHAWGAAPLGYRVTNLLLHLAAALLVWRVAAGLRGPAGFRHWGAALAGLLFAVHPLAVESVAWIAELSNLLALVLLLAAFDAWLDGEGSRWRAFAWFVAALLAKSTAAAFPLVLLLHSAWRRGRPDRADLRAILPFLGAALGFGAVAVAFERARAIGSAGPPLEGLGWRVIGSGRLALFYLGKCLWPAGLMPIYPRWRAAPPGVAALLAWPFWAALLVLLWSRRKSWGRPALFGLGCFLAALLPLLGFIPMAYLRLSWAADHFAYLALPAAAILAGAAAEALGAAGLAAGLAAALALAAASRSYARAFTGPEALWTLALERNPGAWSAHNDLGSIRFDQRRLAEAESQFREAVRLNPGYAEGWNNLGVAEAEEGRRGEAESAYRRALALRPAYADARCNLGNALLQDGRPGEEAPEYEAALRLKEPFPEAHYNRGLALRALGRPEEAEREFAASGLPPPG